MTLPFSSRLINSAPNLKKGYNMSDKIQDFIDAMAAQGCAPERASDIKADDKKHRYSVAGDKLKTKNGVYQLKIEPDGFAVGWFLNFKEGITHKWHSFDKRETDPAKIEERRARIEADRAKAEQEQIQSRKNAQKRAKELWSNASAPDPEHPYIKRKAIKPHGIRQDGSTLYVPMYSVGGLVSLQRIYDDGSKRFIKDGEISGAYTVVKNVGTDDIIICEGYATGATLYEALNKTVVVAFNAGNLKAVAMIMRDKYPDAIITIAADNDAWTVIGDKEVNTGIIKATEAARACDGLIATYDITDDMPQGTTDYNDVALLKGLTYIRDVWRAVSLDPVLKQGDPSDDFGATNDSPPHFPSIPIEAYENEAVTDWRERLIMNDKGRLIPKSAENTRLFTKHHSDLEGCFSYNIFTGETYIVQCPPWETSGTFKAREVDENDIRYLICYLERFGLQPSKDKAFDAIEMTANENKRNPARDYFDSLKWDGTPRLDTWLTYYMGAETEPAEYLAFIGRKWLMAGAARVYDMGTKFDHMLVIEGKQGTGKSTMLETLATFGHGKDAESYFIDDIKATDIGDKDLVQKTRGCLIVEMSELAGFSKKDDQEMKSWVTTKRDKIRLPYARRPVIIPRQFIIAATTNDYEYLKDPTGNRRYWCFKTGAFDLEALKRDRAQLWAEAVYRYKAGESIAPTPKEMELASEVQQSRIMHDDWTQDVTEAIKILPYTGFLARDVLREMGFKAKEINFQASRRIGNILRLLGYENKPVWENGRTLKRWVKDD